jgi:hypothetical protein
MDNRLGEQRHISHAIQKADLHAAAPQLRCSSLDLWAITRAMLWKARYCFEQFGA